MKNADMPAMPIATTRRVGDVEESTSEAVGLTKREMMAMSAMRGLISSRVIHGGCADNKRALARDAISYADALLAELGGASK